MAGHDASRRDAYDVRDALEAAGFDVESADTPMVSENLVPVATVEEAKKVLRIVEAIEDNDDVQDVFANFDIPDDVMDEVDGAADVVSVGGGRPGARRSRCRARAGGSTRWPTTPASRWCSSSTRATTRRCARSS